jgi:hypothetical protein
MISTGWQVRVYQGVWVPSGEVITGRVLFGGQVFKTRRDAESAWYDTMPGRNDRAAYVKVERYIESLRSEK